MPADYLLAVDQGTSSSRAVVFDSRAQPVASAQQEFKQIYPQPGWVEHDPEEIWQSILDVMKKAIANSGVKTLVSAAASSYALIAALSISGFCFRYCGGSGPVA